jgi:hypothetical protein
VNREERIGPTEETKAKLLPDVVGNLLADGEIEQVHVDASDEIRRIWEALARTLGSKAQNHVLVSGRASIDPVDALSDVENIVLRERFQPWAEAENRIVIRDFPRRSRFDLTIDVVVNNMPPTHVGQGHVVKSLHNYAVLSGWLTRLA